MINIGNFQEDMTIQIPFNTFNSLGASVTVTNLAAGDVKIHKNGTVAERTGSSGVTVLIDFDGITGNHIIEIDLSDNDDAGFYAIESDYTVRLEGITVDGQILNVWIGTFSIVNRNAMWDRVLTGATHNIATSSGRRLRGIQEFQGYENGAVWVNTLSGTAGTVNYENGTVEKPVLTIADARIIADNLNMKKFQIISGSTITFAQSFDGFEFNGENWTLALGGQSVSGSVFHGASVTGICTGANKPSFEHCHFGNVTLPPCIFKTCSLGQGIISGNIGDYFFNGCYSSVAGTALPCFDFGSGIGISNLNMRHYSGGIEIENMANGDNMSLEGFGQLVINANCAGGTVAIRGNFTVTDNASEAVTLSDDARIDVNNIFAGSTIDGNSASEIMQLIMAMVDGRFTKSGNVYTLYKRDNSTVLTTITISDSARTRS